MEEIKSLTGKKALVTGGTRGIGAEIASKLKHLGASVSITGTQSKHDSADFQYFGSNFKNIDNIESLAEFIKHSQFDILVNNAGINKINSINDISVSEFVEIQQVNVTAPLILMQAALPYMSKNRWGRIVNVSSIWGKVSKKYRASYSASKFAIDGLTIAISAEVASAGILVNSVAPGFIDTELTRQVLKPHEISVLESEVPIKRLGTAEEIAKFVCWLSSPENTYITGQNIAIDGGFTRV